VAELGFGTGLNFLTALQAFRASSCGGRLHFTSFEAFPMADADMRAALALYPDLPVDALFSTGDDYVLTVINGDVRDTLPVWSGMADAWFLDGFAPAKNPAMWGPDVLQEVARHTALTGTFATYTAVGEVRRTLASVGFAVERIPGYGRKRHMTKGRLA
jgi:tRNA U34 5-methylaminomethyl-2-thiouridine-forming methyltransferase MnmC